MARHPRRNHRRPAGLLLASAAATLVATGTADSRGVTIPVLHNDTSDQPVAYTPACSADRLPVCVHLAYPPSSPHCP
ncbi:hypothetical protein AB0F52_14640 [Amycolatopsis sp. NPDC024027]|uniref:hypothetical protein n=1 Tax=Amycolatopsis sp. NPDC024027 TaxID=3154327 RepID=UPI0033C71F1E